MPEWTKKDERQYEHIKESELDRGSSVDRAEEIAGRTVNKQRRKEDRTPEKRTSGTGNPNVRLEDRTKDELTNRAKDELTNRAKELGIKGAANMKKQELADTIRDKS